jgi:hypothetical protein
MNRVGSAHDLGPRTFSPTSSAFCSESKAIKTRSLMVPTLVRSNRSTQITASSHGGTPTPPATQSIARSFERDIGSRYNMGSTLARDRVGVKSMTIRAFRSGCRTDRSAFPHRPQQPRGATSRRSALQSMERLHRARTNNGRQHASAINCPHLASSLPVLAARSHDNCGRIPKIGLCKIDHLIERMRVRRVLRPHRVCAPLRRFWVQVPPGERPSPIGFFSKLARSVCATSASPSKSCEERMEISHATPPRNTRSPPRHAPRRENQIVGPSSA